MLIAQFPPRRTAADVSAPATASPRDVFAEYFRCRDEDAAIEAPAALPAEAGFFRFGGAVCYGRQAHSRPSDLPSGLLPDVSGAARVAGGRVTLPFDLQEVATNLRQERYARRRLHLLESLTSGSVARDLYYFLRPAMSVAVRRHFQKLRLAGWDRIAFPSWPVDTSVDVLMRQTMALLLRRPGVSRIPFVWFWPDGAPSCAIVTHDVEGPAGLEFCDALMDLDASFGIRSSFQVIPGHRGPALDAAIERMRARGFEVNLHDFNHDGYLFHNRAQFLDRAARINHHARELGCRGFRSAVMYREQPWFDAFEFSYDMSVPNTAHLDPQRGGCCTVMPYFVGRVLELPLTTTQDYSLFHILGDYSTAIWKRQIPRIAAANGLVTILTHPDYLVEARARAVYAELLGELRRMQGEGELWLALPGEVDRWWRSRAQMRVVRRGDSWQVEGPGSERARVAWAALDGGRVVYSISGRL